MFKFGGFPTAATTTTTTTPASSAATPATFRFSLPGATSSPAGAPSGGATFGGKPVFGFGAPQVASGGFSFGTASKDSSKDATSSAGAAAASADKPAATTPASFKGFSFNTQPDERGERKLSP